MIPKSLLVDFLEDIVPKFDAAGITILSAVTAAVWNSEKFLGLE